jgi:ribonuclease HII
MMKKYNMKELEGVLSECTYEDFLRIKEELLNEDRKGIQNIILKTERKFDKQFKKIEEYKKRRLYEDKLLQTDIRFIAGVDEVGRGPLAGPVYAAAVILDPLVDIIDIKDSKKLSPTQREEIADIIRNRCIDYSIGISTVEEIDRLNILNATKLAMKRAIEGLSIEPQHILIDALKLSDINIPQTSIIKGDDLSISIGAASIVAKVARDKYMDELSQEYPQYGFDNNKGYGTEEHISAIKSWGITKVHRRSFLKNFI